jgi:hypothetical protein
MSWTLHSFLIDSFLKHIGPRPFQIFGDTFAPTLMGLGVLSIFCLVLYWMYKRKIFLRI